MNIDVFVSHHTSSSLHIVEGIVNKLEAAGIRCWYAPRDTEDAYASSIARALESCSVFLLILNRPASESFHVLNEIDMVTKRLVKGEDVKILPFHVADDEIGPDAQYYLGRLHWIDAMTPPMYKRVDELVERIAKLLGKSEAVSSASSAPAQETSYRLVSKMPQAREIFDGRDYLIKQMEDAFASGKRALFLEGIGGIGKSELAKQYALRHKDQYDHIVFATYESTLENLLCNSGAVLIENLEQMQDEDTTSYFQRKLQILQSISSERTLLIIDNFDVDDDEQLKPFLEGNYRIIFTTRNTHPGYTTVKVEAIQDLDVLFGIFEKNYGASLSMEERAYIEEIFRTVEYHTYTIELIAKQMEASFLSAEEMAALLKDGSLKSEITESVSGRHNMNTAFGHICSVFNTSNLDENDKQILRFLSLTGTGGIPAVRFKEWAELPSFDPVNALIRKSWVRKESGQRLSLHPLVKEVVHEMLTPTYENCDSFIYQAAKFCSKSWFRDYKENIGVANTIVSMLDYFKVPDGNNVCVLESPVNFLWQVGKFDDCIRLSHLLYQDSVDKLGADTMDSGFAAKVVGGCYFNSGYRKESIPWYKKGLEHMLASGHEETEDLAMSYEKVGRCYTWEYEQDFEAADKYFQEALAIRLRLLDALKNGEAKRMFSPFEDYGVRLAQIRIGESYMEMGRMNQMAGNHEKALEYVTKQGNILDTEFPDDLASQAYVHYDKGVCHYHLGKSALNQGNTDLANTELTLAEEHFSKALELNMKRRGALALDTIDNQEYLADTYAAQKKYGEASNAYMAVITMVENLLGKENERIQKVKEKMDFETI